MPDKVGIRTRVARVIAAASTASVIAYSGGVAMGDPTPISGAGLPRAETIRLPKLDPALLQGSGDQLVRVGLVLSEQPVLEQTTRPSFQSALSGYTRGDLQQAARENPQAVSELEAEAARGAERRRNTVGRALADETAELEAEESSLEPVIDRAGGEFVRSAQSGPLAMVTARVPRSELEDFAHRADIQAVIPQPKVEPELDTSTTTIGASSVWAQHNGGGDDGVGGVSDVRTGIEVGMAGDPPDPGHPAFAGIAIDNGATSPGAHGTSTAGVLTSRDATYRGVAPGISALLGGIADQWGSTDVDARNESFGNMPDDDNNANVADLAAHTFLVPWAASAGNRNTDPEFIPGEPTTGGNAMGRNILSVGAFGDGSTISETDNVVADFSSFGPSPGGRKEPEITAPGVAITGPGIGGGIDTNSGTSLAAPHVAGALAILVGAGMTDPRTMRAVLVNSAQPWCNGHNHTPPSGTSLLTTYPSGTCQDRWLPDVGWGELDVPAALAQRGNAVIGDVEGGSARFYRATADPGERATLAWNMRGVLGPDVTQHVYYTVTNLNLRQYRPDETEILPASDPGWGAGPDAIDPNDATEQVRAPSPGGDIIYKVEAASTVEGAPSERFGLASANPLTALENPGVDPIDVAHSASGCEQNVHITAAGRNPSSDIEAGTSTLSLELPAGVQLVVGPQSQQVSGGVVETDSTSEAVSWTVRPTTSGNHEVKIRGEGRAYGTTFTSRETITLASDCASHDPGPGDPEPPPTDTTIPQVNPHGLVVQPPGAPQCGIRRTLFAGFDNPTSRDALDARGSLALSGSTELLGPGVHPVSGGVLEGGSSSEIHSWQFRESAESTAATVTGSAVHDGHLRTAQARLNLSCRLTETSIDGKARLRKGKIRVDGALRFNGPREISIAGERVRVLFERPDKANSESVDESGAGRRKADLVEHPVKLERDGTFAASIGACRKGRYKVRAGFAGAPGYEPARRRTLATLRSDGC